MAIGREQLAWFMLLIVIYAGGNVADFVMVCWLWLHIACGLQMNRVDWWWYVEFLKCRILMSTQQEHLVLTPIKLEEMVMNTKEEKTRLSFLVCTCLR